MFATLRQRLFGSPADPSQSESGTGSAPATGQPSQIDSRIKKLELKARKLAQRQLLGRYRSRFKGRGLEFRDFREYLPGDDVRTIDWNVTARFGKPFVKNSEEERELAVVVILDVSPSQDFGSSLQTKGDLARELATLLIMTAHASGDKVGLLIGDGKLTRYIPPAKGRHQKQRVLQSVWQDLQGQTQTREATLTETLEQLNSWLRRRGFLCLISDFLSDGLLEARDNEESERFTTALRNLSFRHETMALRTQDLRELEIPNVGEIVLRDLTDGRSVRVDTSHSDWKKKFGERWSLWNRMLDRVMKRSQWDLKTFQTNVDPVPSLIAFLDSRGRKR